MTRGKEIVYQVNSQGELIKDYDFKLTRKELFNVLNRYFPNVRRNEDCSNYIETSQRGKKYLIRVKNITYLGKPHSENKKRYQIPDDLLTFYQYAKEHDFQPLMIGVYTYKGEVSFVNFSIESYIDKLHNNSSAHVQTEDIQQIFLNDEMYEEETEVKYGFFEKIDMMGNRITVFDRASVNYFLDNYKTTEPDMLQELRSIKQVVIDRKVNRIGKENKSEVEILFDECRIKTNGAKLLPNKTRNIILNYFVEINKEWFGKECYRSMFESDYRNQNQAEWPGFYLEYSFENYLKDKGYINVLHYAQEKIDGGIDLDLYLEELQVYADLKAHTENKKDIPGNKRETVEEALSQKGQVIYIVCEHETEMDDLHDLEVTKYWNLNKKNRNSNIKIDSYAKRMKNNVKLKRVKILSINETNIEYLKGFQQGKNSNGKSRKVKIMIDGKHINKFLRLTYEF